MMEVLLVAVVFLVLICGYAVVGGMLYPWLLTKLPMEDSVNKEMTAGLTSVFWPLGLFVVGPILAAYYGAGVTRNWMKRKKERKTAVLKELQKVFEQAS